MIGNPRRHEGELEGATHEVQSGWRSGYYLRGSELVHQFSLSSISMENTENRGRRNLRGV